MLHGTPASSGAAAARTTNVPSTSYVVAPSDVGRRGAGSRTDRHDRSGVALRSGYWLRSGQRQQQPCLVCRAVERDLDWEPEVKPPATTPAGRSGSSLVPPPPTPPVAPMSPFLGGPFRSRRDIALTLLGGSAGLWLLNHKVIAPIDSFGAKPPIDFTLAGYTDLNPNDFVYFKTPGGRWVAAAEDAYGRFFMIDEVGDLYYDSGDPQIGLYAMDTQGNLFNFFVDTDGKQKITPVGNVADLTEFKISEIAGIKLDRDVNVVAFKNGSVAPLPPGSEFIDPLTGDLRGPDQLLEGLNSDPYGMAAREERLERNPLSRMLRRNTQQSRTPLMDRPTVDLKDPRDFGRQIFDQTLLDDPDLPGFQVALPDNFDMEALMEEVKEEGEAAGAKRRR